MFGSIGVPELLVLIVFLCGVVLVVLPACRICRKAGYPAWLGVGAIVPVLNVLLLCLLGFTKWPIERELELLRKRPAAQT
jgi:hypothetical protein